MKITKLNSVEEINSALRDNEFQFELQYKLSEIVLGDYDCTAIDYDELIEARLFSTNMELRIFDYNGSWRGALIEDGDNDEAEIYNKKVTSRIKKNTSLAVKKYYEADDDGQLCVACTRLCGIEKG